MMLSLVLSTFFAFAAPAPATMTAAAAPFAAEVSIKLFIARLLCRATDNRLPFCSR